MPNASFRSLEHTQTSPDTCLSPSLPPQCNHQVATAPVLVLVGAMMMGESHQIEWHNMLVAVPAFLTIVIQPFTFSIANGIYAGLVMSALVYLLTGTFLEVGRGYIANLWGGDGVDAPAADGAAIEGGGALDATEAAAAQAAKDESLEAPLLAAGGSRAGGSAADLASLHGSFTGALGASDAISITHRRSRDASGSLSRSHPYERGSFGMLINTHGSHTSGPVLAGLHGTHGILGSPHHPDPFGPTYSNLPSDDH